MDTNIYRYVSIMSMYDCMHALIHAKGFIYRYYLLCNDNVLFEVLLMVLWYGASRPTH